MLMAWLKPIIPHSTFLTQRQIDPPTWLNFSMANPLYRVNLHGIIILGYDVPKMLKICRRFQDLAGLGPVALLFCPKFAATGGRYPPTGLDGLSKNLVATGAGVDNLALRWVDKLLRWDRPE